VDFYRKVSFIAIIVVWLILVAGPFLFKFYPNFEKGEVQCESEGGHYSFEGRDIRVYDDRIELVGVWGILDSGKPRRILIQTKGRLCVIAESNAD